MEGIVCYTVNVIIEELTKNFTQGLVNRTGICAATRTYTEYKQKRGHGVK